MGSVPGAIAAASLLAFSKSSVGSEEFSGPLLLCSKISFTRSLSMGTGSIFTGPTGRRMFGSIFTESMREAQSG